jgi:hypothetical protein
VGSVQDCHQANYLGAKQEVGVDHFLARAFLGIKLDVEEIDGGGTEDRFPIRNQQVGDIPVIY